MNEKTDCRLTSHKRIDKCILHMFNIRLANLIQVPKTHLLPFSNTFFLFIFLAINFFLYSFIFFIFKSFLYIELVYK